MIFDLEGHSNAKQSQYTQPENIGKKTKKFFFSERRTTYDHLISKNTVMYNNHIKHVLGIPNKKKNINIIRNPFFLNDAQLMTIDIVKNM